MFNALLTLYEVWLVERGMQTMLEGQAHHLIYAKGFYKSRPFSDKRMGITHTPFSLLTLFNI